MSALITGAVASMPCAGADLADPDAAVEAGRSALRSQSHTPWYDRTADGYQPINLPAPRPPADLSWLENLFSAIGWFFSSFGNVLLFLMWLAIAALVVWIVVALLRAWRRGEQRQLADSETATLSGEQISRVEALPVAIDKPMTNLLEEARRLAALGDYAMAVVYLFSHQLVEADSAGALRLRKGKTNRQYLRELARNRRGEAALPPLLQRTMLAFEQSFFGARPPSEAEFTDCLAGVERFDAMLRRSVPEENA